MHHQNKTVNNNNNEEVWHPQELIEKRVQHPHKKNKNVASTNHKLKLHVCNMAFKPKLLFKTYILIL